MEPLAIVGLLGLCLAGLGTIAVKVVDKHFNGINAPVEEKPDEIPDELVKLV